MGIMISSLSVARVWALRGAKMSLRQIAREYPPCTHRDIARLLTGKEPHGAEKRRALGLPMLAPAPVCARCGLVHRMQPAGSHAAPVPAARGRINRRGR